MAKGKKDPAQLSAQEKRFAALYVENGRNATRAYHTIFPHAALTTAASRGSELVRKPNVSREIFRLTEAAFEQEIAGAKETLGRISRIARVDPAELTWQPGELDAAGQPTVPGNMKHLYEMPLRVRECIQSIKNTEYGVEVKFWNKDAQLTNLGKHHRVITENVDVNVNLGFGERLRKAREKRLRRSE